MHSLEQFLQINKNLEEINLSNCKIDKHTAKNIGKGLTKNIALKSLLLSGN